jgi:hypothetical protein
MAACVSHLKHIGEVSNAERFRKEMMEAFTFASFNCALWTSFCQVPFYGKDKNEVY